MEQTLIIFKPDAINRGLVGEILHRFERKGLKLVAMKMIHLDDDLLGTHYFHLKDRPFFPVLKRFMSSAPSIVSVIEGVNAVEVVRNLVGSTKGYEANAGTIRGDYSISSQCNVIHASDSKVNANIEIARFFNPDEIFSYEKIDLDFIYSEDEIDR